MEKLASKSTDVSVALRPMRREDEPFLFQVYASTREQELALVDWDAAQKDAFLRQQFQAQHVFYQEQFPDADFLIVLVEGKRAGRLYVHRRADEIRLVDIALLPEFQNSGTGSALLRDLLDEAEEASLPVRIHVEMFNPALRLYERLGFRKIEDNGVYYLMEWTPFKMAELERDVKES